MIVYVLTHTREGESGFGYKVSDVFLYHFDARKAMWAACDKALSVNFNNVSLETIKAESKSAGRYEYKEDPNGIHIYDRENGHSDDWDITEKYVDGERPYIDILFNFDGKLMTQRVYRSSIDFTADEKLWSYSFTEFPHSCESKGHVFELVGTRENGRWITSLWVNVYKDEFADDPYMKIENIKVHKSWLQPVYVTNK